MEENANRFGTGDAHSCSPSLLIFESGTDALGGLCGTALLLRGSHLYLSPHSDQFTDF